MFSHTARVSARACVQQLRTYNGMSTVSLPMAPRRLTSVMPSLSALSHAPSAMCVSSVSLSISASYSTITTTSPGVFSLISPSAPRFFAPTRPLSFAVAPSSPLLSNPLAEEGGVDSAVSAGEETEDGEEATGNGNARRVSSETNDLEPAVSASENNESLWLFLRGPGVRLFNSVDVRRLLGNDDTVVVLPCFSFRKGKLRREGLRVLIRSKDAHEKLLNQTFPDVFIQSCEEPPKLSPEETRNPDGTPFRYQLEHTSIVDEREAREAITLLNNGNPAVLISGLQTPTTLQSILYLFRRESVYVNPRRVYFVSPVQDSKSALVFMENRLQARTFALHADTRMFSNHRIRVQVLSV
mmetsp:Transcript_14975/g.44870  ORF Transcript_14975/g.44870 Transcript_14975/m.44870 type:complete len:355 (+) Transcript_14975:70-1134(+)